MPGLVKRRERRERERGERVHYCPDDFLSLFLSFSFRKKDISKPSLGHMSVFCFLVVSYQLDSWKGKVSFTWTINRFREKDHYSVQEMLLDAFKTQRSQLMWFMAGVKETKSKEERKEEDSSGLKRNVMRNPLFLYLYFPLFTILLKPRTSVKRRKEITSNHYHPRDDERVKRKQRQQTKLKLLTVGKKSQ